MEIERLFIEAYSNTPVTYHSRQVASAAPTPVTKRGRLLNKGSGLFLYCTRSLSYVQLMCFLNILALNIYHVKSRW
ncbi:hypothetical protein HNQ91_006094 [Filimonas zeae]|nr:hypothetical protein [Filimonas zeae]